MEVALLLELLLMGSLVGGSTAVCGRALWTLARKPGRSPKVDQVLQAARTLGTLMGSESIAPGHALAIMAMCPEVSVQLQRRRLQGAALANEALKALHPPGSRPQENLIDRHEVARRPPWDPALLNALTLAYEQSRSVTPHRVDLTLLMRGLMAQPGGAALERLRQAQFQLQPLDEEPLGGTSPVYLMNDPNTPMEHVVEILTEVFGLSQSASLAAMLTAHHTGAAALGPFFKEEAEQLIEAATERTYASGHNLCFTIGLRTREAA